VDNSNTSFLVGLKSLLKYHEAIGVSPYPQSDVLQRFLSISPAATRSTGSTGIDEQVAPAVQSPVERAVLRPVETIPTVKLSEIEDEVNSCSACDLHKSRLYPVAGKGNQKVRLMIVGDWLSADRNGALPENHVFGVEQDLMLGRMLTAIKLPAAEVFITNVIKCAVPATCQPLAVHVQSCVSYLRRQIVSLQPEIICTMGMVASRAVLEKSLPLSRLRGRLHPYKINDNITVPVLTTYHPTYLLQNPEMKQATWADLQFLGKRLGLPIG